MKPTVLIDADTLVYEVARSVETPAEWEGGVWTYQASLPEAQAKMEERVLEIRDAIGCGDIVLALTDYSEPNWRNEVYPEYKTHRRKGDRRPLLWHPLREFLLEVGWDGDEWEVYTYPGLEGDDVLGILMTGDTIPGEKVCVSIDKDMKTIPGSHWNYGKAKEQPFPYLVTEEEALRFHLLQAIAGDQTDGYGGAPGFGMARAEKILDAGQVLIPQERTITKGARKGELELRWVPSDGETAWETVTPWEIVTSIYEAAGLGEEEALSNARVARILWAHEYDIETQEVRLWTP